jgi:DNA-directed RNA polymerase specialized sigma24 family protein
VGVTRTDGELLAAAARGDGAAFGCFNRRHERRVLIYAVGHCIGASDIADLVAETFLQALVSAGRFRSTDGDALPWLLGISRHVLARQRRSFVRRQRLLDRLSAVPAFTPDETDAVDAAIDVARLAPTTESNHTTRNHSSRQAPPDTAEVGSSADTTAQVSASSVGRPGAGGCHGVAVHPVGAGHGQ